MSGIDAGAIKVEFVAGEEMLTVGMTVVTVIGLDVAVAPRLSVTFAVKLPVAGLDTV